MNISEKQNTRAWSAHWGQPLVEVGRWTIAEDQGDLRLWQLSHGCQYCAGPVTKGDLEELLVCVQRTMALLSERDRQTKATPGGHS